MWWWHQTALIYSARDGCRWLLFPEEGYLEEDSPFGVVSLGEEASLGHSGLGQIHIHTAPFQPLLQLYRCQLVVQLGIGVCGEVTVAAVDPSAARQPDLKC